ncbi:MAG: hypothetical protein WC661_09685 [Opitutaceae bacterium]|jgi:hypothetical protein
MRRFVHWLEDAASCVWALLYWNARKSLYVLGRRRGRCPCQDPSDAGTSGPAHCDAVLHLNKPMRFRHVCPLLVPGPGGKGAFCGVPADKVRPFWGRALKFFGGSLLVLYIAGTSVFFIGMRATGVNTLSWRQVAWPGAWGQITHERSKYFFKQAITACAAHDYQTAFRSMATALALDPHNYDARLLMAQYSEFAGEFLTGDRFFKSLLREFPETRARTAITFHDTLLSMGRHETLALHCLDMAGGDNPDHPTWTGSLLLAMHLGKLGPAFPAKHPDAIARLDPDSRRLVQAQALLNDGKVNEARAGLRHAFTAPVNANHVIQQIRMFLRTGSPADAEVAWTINARDLEPFDRQLARCWIDHGLGYASLAAMEFASLADGPQTEQTLDKLVATLVMQPDPDAFRALHRRMLAGQEAITLQAAGEMWLAALVCQAPKERDHWARICAERFLMDYPPISTIRFDSRDKEQKDTVPFLVNAGVFSRETINGLYWKTRQDGGNNDKQSPFKTSR